MSSDYMNLTLRLPFLNVKLQRVHYMLVYFFILLYIVCVAGYLLNFQNIWQYFPDVSTLDSMSSFLDKVNFRFVVSIIGIFISPIGIITGYLW